MIHKFLLSFITVLTIHYHTLAQEEQVIAVIQEPFIVLLDPNDGSVIDNTFIDLSSLNPSTPKALLQVEDEIWVSDQIEDRIDRFDLEGVFIASIGGQIPNGGLDNIKGMEVVDDEVWVTNGGSNNGAPDDAIIRLDFDGNILGSIDTGGDSSFDIIDVGSGEVFISYIGSNTRIERRDYDGNIIGNVVETGIVTFIQQMELNSVENTLFAAVFSSTGPNLAGLYEFNVSDGTIADSWALGSLRGVAQLEDGNILLSGGGGFGIQILNPSTGNTAVISTDSAQYFGRIVTCITPDTPIGDANQTFNDGATIADIVVSPVDITWFATQNDAQNNENPLPNTTLLVDGETYYAVNIIDSCLSDFLEVTVNLILSNEDLLLSETQIFPNPVINKVTLISQEVISYISLSNILGQTITTKSINSSSYSFDMSSYSKGIYFLKIVNDNGNFRIKKLIKK